MEKELSSFLKEHPHVKVVGELKAPDPHAPKREYAAGSIPLEDDEQKEYVSWLRNEHPEIKFFAVPNGARVAWSTAKKLKATGMEAGIPDLVFPEPMGCFHGYYQEMKRTKGGKISDDQFIWIEFLRGQNYCVDVVEGCEEAKLALMAYRALGPFKGTKL